MFVPATKPIRRVEFEEESIQATRPLPLYQLPEASTITILKLYPCLDFQSTFHFQDGPTLTPSFQPRQEIQTGLKAVQDCHRAYSQGGADFGGWQFDMVICGERIEDPERFGKGGSIDT